MKPDELRKRLAAKQHQGEPKIQDVEQKVNILGFRKEQRVAIRFAFQADNLVMTLEQAIDHGTKVIAAAVACGGKFDPKALEREVAQDKRLLETEEAQRADKGAGGNGTQR